MQSTKRLFTISLLAAQVFGVTPALAQGSANLSVAGSLVEAQTFSVARLKQLPQQEIADSRSIERDGVRQTRRISYRGVLLRDVVLAAGFQENRRQDVRRTLFVAAASDGYISLFTWGEIFNSEAGNNVLVILEADGKPLPDGEGPLALRALADIRPGPRHVRWLKEIRVTQLEK